MAFKVVQLTLNGAAQQLSTAFSTTVAAGETVSPRTRWETAPIRTITFQMLKASSNDCFVGDSSAVSSSVHAFRVDATDTNPPIVLGGHDEGPMKLADFWVLGTNAEVLCVGIVEY